MKWIFSPGLALLIGLLTACSITGQRLQFITGKQVNWDNQHRSLPVVVRIYQLRDPKIFTKASFRELWQHDSEILGQSLLQRDEFTLSPHTHYQMTIKPQGGAHYIAAMALFREPKAYQWRVIKAVNNSFINFIMPITFLVENNTIRIKR
jgi:type VI secretion system protein VasD